MGNSEEIPNPRINVPRAIGAQMSVGFLTGLCYLIALFYGVNDINAVFDSTFTNPLAEVYRQATNSNGGSLGLLVVIFLPTVCTCIGTYITSGRMLWTLVSIGLTIGINSQLIYYQARDRATPFSDTIGKISPRFGNPFAATLVCGCICTVLGIIYIGSAVAFNAFVDSFVVLSTASYLAAILPHLLGRRKNITPGPFWMPDWIAYIITPVACAYMLAFIVIFCFPYS